LLAARGADFFRYNNEGRAPIHDAAESRLFLLPELLIHVDQLNFADSAGNLTLHLAIIEKNTAAALYLIAYSSLEELTLPNNHGLNPLELARQSGKEPIIQAIEAKLSKG
jgi:ankyrin repeat protein